MAALEAILSSMAHPVAIMRPDQWRRIPGGIVTRRNEDGSPRFGKIGHVQVIITTTAPAGENIYVWDDKLGGLLD